MVPLRMLFYLLLVLSLWCNPAESAGPWADDQPPLRLNEFERWVEKMAGESADDPAVLASKLQNVGFTCTPSDAIQFRCTKFGCSKGSGMLWRGALLQWSVHKSLGKFHGTAMSYGWMKGCYSPERVEQEQKLFNDRL